MGLGKKFAEADPNTHARFMDIARQILGFNGIHENGAVCSDYDRLCTDIAMCMFQSGMMANRTLCVTIKALAETALTGASEQRRVALRMILDRCALE